jgi:WD40 repeat protein
VSAPLPPDKLDLLLPTLRHIAEVIQRRGAISRDDLLLLLLGSGIDEDWAVEETSQWSKILVAARAAEYADRRELAGRALMLRGIPEAAAMLAISLVAAPQVNTSMRETNQWPISSAVLSPTLMTSVDRIDLGTLSANTAGHAEFDVSGGPGHIVVDSPQVHVLPSEFGREPTRVQVYVSALSEGLLWTSLRLLSGDTTKEVALVAQWLPPQQETAFVPQPPVEQVRAKSPVPVRVHTAPSVKTQRSSTFPLPVSSSGWDHGVKHLDAGVGPVLFVGFATKELLLIAGEQGARLINLDSNICVWEVLKSISTVAFSSEKQLLLALATDDCIELWNPDKGQLLQLHDYQGRVHCLAISSTGLTLACGSSDTAIYLWNARNGKTIGRLKGHADLVSSVAFNPSLTQLASASPDKTMRLWELGLFWGLKRQPEIRWRGQPDYTPYRCCDLAFSPGGTMLVTGNSDSSIRLFNADGGKGRGQLPGHNGPVRSFAFSRNGRTMASGSDDTTVRIWDVLAGQSLQRLEGHTSPVSSVAFSPTDKVLAAGSISGKVIVWQIA